MGRCIIHAGMPRTGATSIQHSLMTLDDEQFLYAPLSGTPGFPNHSTVLRTLYTPPRDPRHQNLVRHTGKQFEQVLQQQKLQMQAATAAAGKRNLVLSAQGLTRMSGMALTRMRNQLGRKFDGFSVIAYVRSPLSYAESVVQQRIRDGHADLLDLRALWPRYEACFSRFDTVFGAENVSPVKFAPARFPGGDVVADFCQRVGVDPSHITPVRCDAVLTRGAAKLLHQYALAVKAEQIEAMSPALAAAVADRLAGFDPVPFSLAPAFFGPLLAGQEKDLAWMEARLGEGLADATEAKAGAVASLSELSEPVAGAADHIAALIAESGVSVDGSGHNSVPALLRTLAALIQTQKTGKAGKTGRATQARGAVAQKPKPANSPGPYTDMAVARPGKLPRSALSQSPTPLVNPDKNLVVLWSPKSACTTAYVWFSYISGFSSDVRNYANWPHKHRTEQFQKSKMYYDGIASGMPGATVLKIIREPYGRAVSIYRHALQTKFAEVEVEAWSGGKIDADRGYSFQTFLDLLEVIDMRKVDVHFRPQFHPFEETREIDRVINISKADMFQQLNAFEEERGWPRTDFADLDWLHHLEGKRKAKQEPMQGAALDEVPFSRHQVRDLGQFPSYAQLLTPRARQRIEAIYKVDFDAYGKFL